MRYYFDISRLGTSNPFQSQCYTDLSIDKHSMLLVETGAKSPNFQTYSAEASRMSHKARDGANNVDDTQL